MNWTWDIYTILAIVGAAFFLLQLFTGLGDHDISEVSTDHDISGDHDHSEAKIFSIRSLLVTITFFGIGGKLSMYFGGGNITNLVVGLISGLIAGYITYLLMRFLLKQQSSSIITDKEFIGLNGIVHVIIPKDGVGEVVVETKGLRKYLPAKAKDNVEIKEKASVKVVDMMSGYLIVISA